RADDLAAHREQRHRDQLEVRDAERDADDREAQGDAGGDVAEGQPPAGEDQPQDVAHTGRGARVPAFDGRVPEGPQGVDADAEGGDPERDTDHGDAQQHTCEQVGEEEPEAAEDEPNDVQDGLHWVRPAIFSSRAMRSAIGGWVENIFDSPWPGRNGFAIIMWFVVSIRGSGGSGSCLVPASSLRRAAASASGSPVSWAREASAAYSRERLMASWIRLAARGPRIRIISMPRMPGPSSSLERPTGISQAKFTRNMITEARAPATEEIRMSRLWTWLSSWPMTPRSSRSSSRRRMPSVQHTAALRGLRPVAKALGASVGEMYSRGMGWRAWVESSRTMRYSPGASNSLTGRARIARRAILSLFQYAQALVPTATTTATTRPVRPKKLPMRMMSADSPPRRTAVLSPLCR